MDIWHHVPSLRELLRDPMMAFVFARYGTSADKVHALMRDAAARLAKAKGREKRETEKQETETGGPAVLRAVTRELLDKIRTSDDPERNKLLAGWAFEVAQKAEQLERQPEGAKSKSRLSSTDANRG